MITKHYDNGYTEYWIIKPTWKHLYKKWNWLQGALNYYTGNRIRPIWIVDEEYWKVIGKYGRTVRKLEGSNVL